MPITAFARSESARYLNDQTSGTRSQILLEERMYVCMYVGTLLSSVALRTGIVTGNRTPKESYQVSKVQN
jgi:hypothetical protein